MAAWLKLADYYTWPHIVLFDSWDELAQKLLQTDLKDVSQKMLAHIGSLEDGVRDVWASAFERVSSAECQARARRARDSAITSLARS